jgi:hypothetical protein
MTALLAAFSLQDKIEQYGAYAGVAAIFGLGVLSLLYFAQAREVKRLREWAGRAPERQAELEARVASEAQRRVTAPAGPATPAPATPAARPATPAPAAPATAAGAAAAAPAAAGPGGGAPPATVPKPATAAPQNGTGESAAVPVPAKPGEPPTPPPTAKEPVKPRTEGEPAEGETAAVPAVTPEKREGPPNGKPAAAPPAPAIPAAAAAGAAAAAARSAAPGSQQPPERAAAPLRAPGASATVPPRTPAARRPTSADDGSRARVAAIVGAVVAVLAVVAVAAVIIFASGGGDKAAQQPNSVASPTPTTGTNAKAPAEPKAAAPRVVRSRYTVAVLNGTTVTGLARQASNRVAARGYKQGTVTTDTGNQARRQTQIFYDSAARPAALDVAKLLGVAAGAVQQMDQNAKALGGGAQVAVFIGADKAQ